MFSRRQNDEVDRLIQRKSDIDNEDKTGSCVCYPWIQKRHVLTIWSFIGFATIYTLRVTLSVTIVAMVNNTDTSTNRSQNNECMGPNDTRTTGGVSGNFNWDEKTQGLILGAFYYGYIVTQIPGGYLATRCGSKFLLGFGVGCSSVLTLLTPLATRLHVGVLIAIRIVAGLAEGAVFPCMHAMLGNWAPVWERSKLSGVVYAGGPIGIVLAMPLSGILSESSFLGGWPSAFYVFGALGLLWFVVWMWIIHETPADHPTITKAEQQYIEDSIGKREHIPTPWKKILTCPALWGIAAGHFANNWLLYLTLTSLPTYMKNILKFDIKSNGFLSGLPYLVVWFMQVLSSYIADFLRSNGYLTTQNTRKLFCTTGLFLSTVFIVGAAYTGCNHIIAVVLLTLAVGSAGITMTGPNINHLDIAPKFAGVLFGITNTLATIPGFLAPIVVGVLTNHNETRGQWRIVFFISAGILLTGAAIFALLCRGEEMSWARERSDTETDIILESRDVNHNEAMSVS